MVDASLKTSLGGGMAFEISDERVDVIAYFALTHILLRSHQGRRKMARPKACALIKGIRANLLVSFDESLQHWHGTSQKYLDEASCPQCDITEMMVPKGAQSPALI